MDAHTEATIKMVADEIGAGAYGPYSVQEGTDAEEHAIIGTFDRAFDAVLLARTTAGRSLKFCFVLDRDGAVVMSYEGRA